MKKVSLSFVFVALFLSQAMAMTIDLDLSGSRGTFTGQKSFRINNLSGIIDGVTLPGKYWIDFTWDPVNMVFVPVNAGEEVPLTGKTWAWTVTNYDDSFIYSITSDPVNRLIYVSYKQSSGTPFICNDETFIQGNNLFEISLWDFMLDEGHALITYTSAFSDCGYFYTGQTVTATISNIPSWFDFSKTFMVGFGKEPMVCEPDGTTHK
jgi:hypothetical protein